ncbi:ABC transporter ATP-binding protein [Caulobacter flavus]|uniref:ABC transporter ATP-binding protein n=1 Tax=Caulobacter flavus TaxID=1679497 RepID=A0A2N5CMP1_9CAUL|nr:ATP-binding cassette domain-containing protein [Caulobacter flavus]AYV47097.1 ABC transporter ATP-binding protein [Caulobacter flavus]PLR07385.1 ABC transporter ATP-binding protein [Caulobacter flavus]
MSAAIETRGLTRRFGARLAVDALSMTVPEQAVYGFLGRNGAGKTTTLKMVLGLIRPTSGAVRVCGLDVARDRIGAARKIGALLEAHGFYGGLSGAENLGLTARLLGLPTTEVERVLEVVEMRADARRAVGGYSLGMRQRLGLARAMLGAPPVLVLDEPTNGLDPDGIADMRQFLKSLPQRTGATVLLSSHLLSEIEQIATHVGVVKDGRLVLEGELARLKAGLAPEILLRTSDDARAAQLLAGSGLTSVATKAGQVVALRPGDDADQVSAALNRILVQADLAVFAIGPRDRSLEDIYRQVAVSPQRQPEAA